MDSIGISKKDILWGYIAQLFNVGANVFILPVVYYLSAERLGIWYVFMNIATFVALFGLVFQSGFSRNISYAFGGVSVLRQEGYDTISQIEGQPNILLVKGLIRSMRLFYGCISIAILALLVIGGTFYINYLSSQLINNDDVLPSWIVFSVSAAIGFYNLHFNSLLYGRGLVGAYNQLTIFNRLTYIILVFIFLKSGLGLWGIALSNILSVVIGYVAGDFIAYKGGLRSVLKKTTNTDENLLGIIWKNTYKLGLSTIATYLSTKGNLFYVSLFLPLTVIAEYGLSLQVVNVLTTASLLYFYSYSPYIAQCWVKKDMLSVRNIYAKSLVIGLLIFILGSVSVLCFGNMGLRLIKANTSFLPTVSLALLLLVYFLDAFHSLAINLLVSQNRVPQLKASIISSLGIFILIPIFAVTFGLGVTGVIMAVGIVQLCYHNWKWPALVAREFDMRILRQITLGIKSFYELKCKTHE